MVALTNADILLGVIILFLSGQPEWTKGVSNGPIGIFLLSFFYVSMNLNPILYRNSIQFTPYLRN